VTIKDLNHVFPKRRIWLQIEDIWSLDRNLGKLFPHDSTNEWLQ